MGCIRILNTGNRSFNTVSYFRLFNSVGEKDIGFEMGCSDLSCCTFLWCHMHSVLSGDVVFVSLVQLST